MFALVWTEGKLHGLNASGPAPKALCTNKLKELGIDEIPKYGWIPVTVPGLPAGWAELSEKFGKLPLSQVLSRAVTYAREGHAVSPTTSRGWNSAYEIYKDKLKEKNLIIGLKPSRLMVEGQDQEKCGVLRSMPGH